MSKLYIFGIGGTGSRVIRSLTMLLAAGVDCNVDTIVPIVIDRDEANGDYSRTKLLIDNYSAINKVALTTNKNRFFKTKIELLNNQLLLRLNDNIEKFEDFIGKDSLSTENKALVEMLFSEETLKLDMTVGFQGNPNIGSVALNQFDNSDLFKAFAADFQQGDKIFIISSIFGGTGASGFPLLRKMLHTENVTDALGNPLPKWGLINKAPIGAISVLPYFDVQPEANESLVDSDTFIDKTRAALSYYQSEDGKLDALYYIADKNTTTFEHYKGGNSQKNNAHFVELASAMSVLDFVNIDIDTVYERKTVYKEFGIEQNSNKISFNDLSDKTKNLLINPLSRFTLFCKYMGFVVGKENKDGNDENVIKEDKSIFDIHGVHQPYYKELNTPNNIKQIKSVQESFMTWMMEMEDQTRKFTPFNLSSTKAFDFIKGNMNICNIKGINFKQWSKVDHTLNKESCKIDKALKDEERFLELFYCATEKLIDYQN